MQDNASIVSVEADISEPLNMLEQMGAKKKTIMRRMLSQIGTAAKNEGKKAYRSSGLKKGTGALYKSIQKKVMKNGSAVLIKPSARKDGSVLYGYALAKGATITAKNGDYLAFQKDGKWIRTKSVTIKPHDYISGPIGRWLKSTQFKAKVDSIVESEIRKLEKENSK
ncbi:MAG: hypothetical protein HUK24_00385 [Sphaerochaetaceae bacterium]|nr:hypothetical protein [Sphaerochaetaceae bacterium]